MSEPGSRPRVLVLDDDPMVVRSTERVLRRAFDVTATSSIASAVSLARSESFAVFVTDYNLGNVTGFDVAQQVLEGAVRAPTIVVFSGKATRCRPARRRLVSSSCERATDRRCSVRRSSSVANVGSERALSGVRAVGWSGRRAPPRSRASESLTSWAAARASCRRAHDGEPRLRVPSPSSQRLQRALLP